MYEARVWIWETRERKDSESQIRPDYEKSYVVLVSTDKHELFRDIAEVFEGLFISNISETEDAVNGTRVQVFFELLREVESTEGNV